MVYVRELVEWVNEGDVYGEGWNDCNMKGYIEEWLVGYYEMKVKIRGLFLGRGIKFVVEDIILCNWGCDILRFFGYGICDVNGYFLEVFLFGFF